MQHYSNLMVWRRCHRLVLDLYRSTQAFPQIERFGLTAQLRRAALSVPTNIAEGAKCIGQKDFAHFLNIAEGSLSETEYLVLVSRDLGYLSAEKSQKYLSEASEILRMLYSLRKTVQKAAS